MCIYIFVYTNKILTLRHGVKQENKTTYIKIITEIPSTFRSLNTQCGLFCLKSQRVLLMKLYALFCASRS